MTALDALLRCANLGIAPVARGDSLVLPASGTAMPAALLNGLTMHKAELLPLLRTLDGLIFVEFCSSSSRSVETSGIRNHMGAPDFKVDRMRAVLVDGRQVEWMPGQQEPADLLDSVMSGATVVARDAHGYARHLWEFLGWPPPRDWLDTSQLARMLGASGNKDRMVLDVLGNGLNGNTHARPHGPERVLLVRSAYALELAAARDLERQLRLVDGEINERGFGFDAELARAVIHAVNEISTQNRGRTAVSGTTITSHRRLQRWLAEHGINVEDVRGPTLAKVLDEPELPGQVRDVILARQDAASMTSRKLAAGLDRVDEDGRIRDSFVFSGARTGRWTGRAFQPQNLPRGAALANHEFTSVTSAVLGGRIDAVLSWADDLGVPASTLLASLVRPCIVPAPGSALVVCDYRQIEARVVLWLAGAHEQLASFVGDRDPYREEAASILGLTESEVTDAQRLLGKTATLGAGFGVGPRRFEVYAAEFGVDWAQLPLTPADVVERWRDRHSAIAGVRTPDSWNDRPIREGGLWNDTEAAVVRVLDGGAAERVGRCDWFRSPRGHLVCRLPSGRQMFYRHPRLESDGSARPSVSYDHGTGRTRTFGAKLVENMCQAVARDVLAGALVNLELQQARPVLHVHDEVVCETAPGAQGHLAQICSTPPAWAVDLPLDVTTYTTEQYGRHP